MSAKGDVLVLTWDMNKYLRMYLLTPTELRMVLHIGTPLNVYEIPAHVAFDMCDDGSVYTAITNDLGMMLYGIEMRGDGDARMGLVCYHVNRTSTTKPRVSRTPAHAVVKSVRQGGAARDAVLLCAVGPMPSDRRRVEETGMTVSARVYEMDRRVVAHTSVALIGPDELRVDGRAATYDASGGGGGGGGGGTARQRRRQRWSRGWCTTCLCKARAM